MSRFLEVFFIILMMWAAPASPSAAEAYPSRPVTIVIPYPAGGPLDTTARELATALSQALGQPFLVENKAGASGTIGTMYALSKGADGYTLLLHSGPQPAVPALSGNKVWDGVAEFEPIGQILGTPNVMFVSPQFPAKSFKDLLQLATAKPGQIKFGYPGQFYTARLLEKETGIKLLEAPFAGATPVMAALLGGHIDVGMLNASAVMPHLTTGRVRALAHSGPARIGALPDVPSFVELGYKNVVVTSWQGLTAPAGTPKPVIEALSRAMTSYLQKPETRAKLEAGGATVVASDPQTFRAFLVQNNKQLELMRALMPAEPR